MKLPIIDNQVALTSDADVSTDVFLGGLRYENSATPKVRATTVSGQYQANGLSFDATGRVFYTDATGGLPAGTTFAGGLPFSPSGALCVSSGAVSTWGNGIPFAANGAVSALFVSGLTFGVTLSSVVGGLPASGSGIVTINQVAPVGAITPVITVSRSTGVAPLAVTFDALGTTAPAYTSLPFSEIYYAWTFGDLAGGATWAYGTRAGVALKNEAFGPVAAHVFETHSASPYTVTCWAFYLDSGGVLRSGSATTTITVTDPDTVFSGTNTICISQNSLPVQGVNGVPATAAVQQVANWSTVETLAQTYKRILLKRGDTWSVTAGVNLDQVSRTGQGIIGAYGTGAKPILQLNYDGSILRTSAVCDDWRFVDLSMTANGVGPRPNGRSFNLVDSTDLLLLRCEATGAYFDITSSGNQGLYVVDSVMGPLETWVSGSGGYCIYNSNSFRVHIMGTQWGGATNHGCRLQGLRLSSIDSNTGTGNILGNAEGAVLTLRGWIPWSASDWTENVVISRNSLAGNDNNLAVLSCSPMHETSSEALRNVIVDGNYVTTTSSNPMTCEVTTGFTVRNNIFVTGAVNSIDVRGMNTSGTPLPTQNFFYNNTFYGASAGGSVTGFYMYGTVSGIVFTNNIVYFPNVTTTTFTNGSGGQVTLTNNSSNSQMRLNLPFVSATPAVPTDFAPAGYAVNGGTWVPVYKNYLGATNSAPREIGAI